MTSKTTIAPPERAARDGFYNGKGGSTKTTDIILTATALAKRGYMVLVPDMDSQGDITERFRARDKDKPTMADVLLPVGKDPVPITEAITVCGWGDDIKADKGTHPWPWVKRIHVIQGHHELADREKEAAEPGSHFRLRRALDQLPPNYYHHILIDTRPELGHMVQNAAAALAGKNDRAWLSLIPTEPEVRGAVRMGMFLSSWRDSLMIPDLRFGGVILNRTQATRLHNTMIDQMASRFAKADAGGPIPIVPVSIPDRIRMAEANSEYKPIYAYPTSERGGLDEASEALADVVIARGVEEQRA